MKNEYMRAQITNLSSILTTFEQACKMAALKQDGYIDKDEEKALKKIKAATDKYRAELEKIKKE